MRTLGLLLLLPFVATASGAVRVEVDSGDRTRTNAIVRFAWDGAGAPPKSLRTPQGLVAVQLTPDNEAIAIIPLLRPGKQQFDVSSSPGDAARLTADRSATTLSFAIEGKPVLSYFHAPSELPRPNVKPIFQRGGYIHPLQTWGGRILTDDYPHNHVHHHGVWGAWTKTQFEGRAPDFWNMGAGKGTVLARGLSTNWAGSVHAGFLSKHDYVDLSASQPKIALNETWTVTVYNNATAASPFFTFDMVTTQRCASASALRLPEYHYGGMGFRGRGEWDGATNASILTSEGITDRVKSNTSLARWAAISGMVDGEEAGVAILCHPTNFRAPQPIRFHPTEPFFCYAPSQGGDWEIKPGEDYVARYRYVTFDGKPDAALIERFWQEYARPPQSRIVAE